MVYILQPKFVCDTLILTPRRREPMMNTPSPPSAQPTLTSLLHRIQAQVLETRDHPAPPKPGEVVTEDIYTAADDARQQASPRP